MWSNSASTIDELAEAQCIHYFFAVHALSHMEITGEALQNACAPDTVQYLRLDQPGSCPDGLFGCVIQIPVETDRDVVKRRNCAWHR